MRCVSYIYFLALSVEKAKKKRCSSSSQIFVSNSLLRRSPEKMTNPRSGAGYVQDKPGTSREARKLREDLKTTLRT